MQVFVSLKGETLEQKVQCVKSVGCPIVRVKKTL